MIGISVKKELKAVFQNFFLNLHVNALSEIIFEKVPHLYAHQSHIWFQFRHVSFNNDVTKKNDKRISCIAILSLSLAFCLLGKVHVLVTGRQNLVPKINLIA